MPVLPKKALVRFIVVCLLAVACSQKKTRVPESAPPVAYTQTPGKVIENAAVTSRILGRDVRYNVYLPSDYSISERSYPVVYLLHGYTDDNTTWVQSGEVNRYADKAIGDGTIPPMIIIMPNADSSWYVNSYDGKEKYEDFFTGEFIPAVEKNYRIRAEKKYRGIAGLSMGGYGTMVYALKYPNLFNAAAALSAAIFDDTTITGFGDNWYNEAIGPVYGRGMKGKDRLTKDWYNNSVLKMVEAKSAADLGKVHYYIDCGDDDKLTKGNCLLHLALFNKEVPHDFRVRNGEHSWSYWRTGVTDALQFIGRGFTNDRF